MRQIAGDEEALKSVTPAQVKNVAARYLAPARDFTVEVLPAPAAAAPPAK